MPATKFILRPMVPARRKMKPPDLDVTPAFRRWRLRLCPAQPLSTAQIRKPQAWSLNFERILHSKISKIMAFLTEQELESLPSTKAYSISLARERSTFSY